MSFILRYVQVARATTEVKGSFYILEIPATDEIHMEDRNHGLASTNKKQNFKGQCFLDFSNRSRVWPVNHLYHHLDENGCQ